MRAKAKNNLHVSQAKPYAVSSIGIKVEICDTLKCTDRIWLSVDKIKDVRKTLESIKFLVS